MNLERSDDGRNTPLGQADTHSWHAVQCWAKFCELTEPAGSIGVLRLGASLSSMMAKPPSTFIFCARTTPAATNVALEVRNALRAEETSLCFLPAAHKLEVPLEMIATGTFLLS